MKHKHKWGKPYRNVFNGPVRVCEAGSCGAIRMASGHIIVMLERRTRPAAKKGRKP